METLTSKGSYCASMVACARGSRHWYINISPDPPSLNLFWAYLAFIRMIGQDKANIARTVREIRRFSNYSQTVITFHSVLYWMAMLLCCSNSSLRETSTWTELVLLRPATILCIDHQRCFAACTYKSTMPILVHLLLQCTCLQEGMTLPENLS